MPDFEPRGFEFTTQLMIPKAQHCDALFRQKTVSLFILGALVWKAMSATIELDRQLCDGAIEIQKVDAAWVLTAEFEFVEPMVTQQTPQAFFGVGGFLAELAGEVAGGGGAGAVFAVLW